MFSIVCRMHFLCICILVLLYLKFIVHICSWYVCVGVHMPQCMCDGQRTTLWTPYKSGYQTSEANTFTCWADSLVLQITHFIFNFTKNYFWKFSPFYWWCLWFRVNFNLLLTFAFYLISRVNHGWNSCGKELVCRLILSFVALLTLLIYFLETFLFTE